MHEGDFFNFEQTDVHSVMLFCVHTRAAHCRITYDLSWELHNRQAFWCKLKKKTFFAKFFTKFVAFLAFFQLFNTKNTGQNIQHTGDY